MQTKPTIRQQVTDHVLQYLVNNPDHARVIHTVTQKVKAWLR
jgi:hypothetical protein